MGGIFGTPPRAPDPVPVPQIDEFAKRRAEYDALKRRKGRGATILTGSGGVSGENVGKKSLLGG